MMAAPPPTSARALPQDDTVALRAALALFDECHDMDWLLTTDDEGLPGPLSWPGDADASEAGIGAGQQLPAQWQLQLQASDPITTRDLTLEGGDSGDDDLMDGTSVDSPPPSVFAPSPSPAPAPLAAAKPSSVVSSAPRKQVVGTKRRAPKKSTNTRRREEIHVLRATLEQLEHELQVARERSQLDPQQQQQQQQTGSSMTMTTSTSTTSNSSTAASNELQQIWEEVAARQRRARQLAEAENARLRAMLDQEMPIAHELLHLPPVPSSVHSSAASSASELPMDDLMESDHPPVWSRKDFLATSQALRSVSPVHHNQPSTSNSIANNANYTNNATNTTSTTSTTSTTNTSVNVVHLDIDALSPSEQQKLQQLDHRFAVTDTAFCADCYRCEPHTFRYVHVANDGPRHARITIDAAWRTPFASTAVAQALWQFAIKRCSERTRVEYSMARANQDTVVAEFTATALANATTGQFRGNMLARRRAMGPNVHVIVSELRGRPVEPDPDPEASGAPGFTVHGEDWQRVQPITSRLRGSEQVTQLTQVQWHHTIHVTAARAAAPGSSTRPVDAFVELVVQQVTHNFFWTQQMVENALLQGQSVEL